MPLQQLPSLPIQQQMLEPVFHKKNVVGRDITGSGKTLAYIIPILESLRADKLIPKREYKDPYALVVVPTRELAIQVLLLCLHVYIPRINNRRRTNSFHCDILKQNSS